MGSWPQPRSFPGAVRRGPVACSAAWPLALQLSVRGGRRHWNPTELTIKPQFKNENVVVRLLNPRACRAGGLRNECPDAIPVPSTPSQPLHHPRSPRRRAIPVSTRYPLSPHAIPAPDAIPVPTTSPSPHNLSQAIPVPVPQHTLPRPQSARLSTSPLPTRSIVSGPDRGAGSSFPLPRGPGRAPAVRGSASSRAVEAQARRPRARLRQSRSRRSRRSRSRRRRSRSRRDGRSAERRGTEKADQRTGDRGAGRRGGGAQELQPPSPFHPRQGPQRRHPPRLLLRACPHRARPPGGTLDSYPAALLREGPQGERAPPGDGDRGGSLRPTGIPTAASRPGRGHRRGHVPRARLAASPWASPPPCPSFAVAVTPTSFFAALSQ